MSRSAIIFEDFVSNFTSLLSHLIFLVYIIFNRLKTLIYVANQNVVIIILMLLFRPESFLGELDVEIRCPEFTPTCRTPSATSTGPQGRFSNKLPRFSAKLI